MIAPIDPNQNKAPVNPDMIPKPMGRKSNRFVWIFSSIVIFMAGSAFLFKLIDFMYTFGRPAVMDVRDPNADVTLRFAIQPVVTYLIVATGFACLFFWAYLTGQFKNVEGPKYRMIEMQDEIDAAEAVDARHAQH